MPTRVAAVSGITAALASVLIVATACTSTAHSTSSALSTAAITSAPASLPSLATDSASLPSDSALPSAPATVPTIPTTTASNAPAPPISPTGPQACTSAELAVSVQSAGAASGQAFATLRFTNTSNSACTLDGYPGVSLMLNGKQLGGAATRSGAAIKTITIAPQQNLTAQLTDNTSCNAAESDTIRIYPPNLTVPVQIPFVLRGCALVVTPVTSS
jgi:Protein of unknown function (DUF4232)